MSQVLDSRATYINTVANNTATKTSSGLVISSNGTKRYYSSVDANIYIGNTFVDEVIAIQFSTQQNTMPLYGYNSVVYDDIAQGQRIIQGNFTINLTKPNFLFDILEVAKKDSSVFFNQDGAVTTESKSVAAATNTFGDTSKPLWDAAFDIDVVLGADNSIHYILEGVVLNGGAVQISGDGSGVVEAYSFMAKNMLTLQ